jgi:hypothetical protein
MTDRCPRCRRVLVTATLCTCIAVSNVVLVPAADMPHIHPEPSAPSPARVVMSAPSTSASLGVSNGVIFTWNITPNST